MCVKTVSLRRYFLLHNIYIFKQADGNDLFDQNLFPRFSLLSKEK